MQGPHPNFSYASVPLADPRYVSFPDAALPGGGLAALQGGVPIKQGTTAWREARAAVPFKASPIGQLLGFHGSKAAGVL
eukprot:38979-Pelagomonas_calceolata.AAC.1